uniref:Uncharacterized protein n=1 Tax=Arundo donax TaxID=35708 RepID=A0A0A8YR44_ARUDO
MLTCKNNIKYSKLNNNIFPYSMQTHVIGKLLYTSATK